jgi:hypothetical protein
MNEKPGESLANEGYENAHGSWFFNRAPVLFLIYGAH